MCFARPVVATATGGIPEVVGHGRTGLLVPVGDPPALAAAVSELLLEPERREVLGRAGRARFAQEFTVERMVDDTLYLYDELLESQARPARPARLHRMTQHSTCTARLS
jgi:glycosyltransferase involved in cell wall biosynthesis